MQPEQERPRSERDLTDESLRVERERTDLALDQELTAIDQTADAVISRARARADEVLAVARARTDSSAATTAGPEAPVGLRKARLRQDRVVLEERATADDLLRDERAEQAALLADERHETDEDPFNERARADDDLATRDEVLGIVSHDLRSLLNAIVGNAALIERDVSRENHAEQVLIHALRIQRAGALMDRLIGDLFDVATVDAGVLTVSRVVADPGMVVTEAVDTFQAPAAAAGISLAVDIQSPLPPVAFDPARILQVLTNLLANAVKFTPPNGHISVRAERVRDEWKVSVTDTGVGVPADKLETIFDRFVQVARYDQRSVGLGLYISKCIVQGHGGRIWAESPTGGGSVFCFTLPAG